MSKEPVNPLESLYFLGARFVLLDGKDGPKSARITGWLNKKRPTVAMVQGELDAGHLIGIQPLSVGMAGLDVDNGGKATLKAVEGILGKPAATIPTQKRGRYHVLYPARKDEDKVGGDWWLPGIAKKRGEFRCAGAGYLVLWNPAAFLAGAGEALTMREVDYTPLFTSAISETTLFKKPISLDDWKPGERNSQLINGVFRAALIGDREEAERLTQACIDSGYVDGAKAAWAVCESSWKAGRAIAGQCLPRNREGLKQAFEKLSVEVRYNLRSMTAEWRRDGGEWGRFDDRSVADLRATIEQSFKTKSDRKLVPMRLGRDRWADCLNAILYQVKMDPVITWLESLPAWDGTERLDHWLNDLFIGNPEPGVFELWAARATILGCIQRAYKPGDPIREIPIFIGPQGIGKSATCRELIPPQFQDEWFADGLDLAAHAKERGEQLQGRLIVEASELTGLRRAEIESVKSFLTRSNDGVHRFAYRQNSEPMPRRCCLIGTSNEPQCLPNEPGGNTRFVPITFKRGANVEAYMKTNRDQLWAEGLTRNLKGERGNMPRSLKTAHAALVERHRSLDEAWPMPRRCCLIGTSNEPQCLPNEPGGNTRFVPITFKRGANVEADT